MPNLDLISNDISIFGPLQLPKRLALPSNFKMMFPVNRKIPNHASGDLGDTFKLIDKERFPHLPPTALRL